MPAVKGNGLISEGGGIVATSVKKSGKAVIREAGKFAKETFEQLAGTKTPPPPKVEPDGEKAEAERQTKIKEISTNIRRLAAKEKEEREKSAQIQEYYRKIREAKLVAEEEGEKKKLPPLAALDWFVNTGKKALGWIFERKKGERKPSGFQG